LETRNHHLALYIVLGD